MLEISIDFHNTIPKFRNTWPAHPNVYEKMSWNLFKTVGLQRFKNLSIGYCAQCTEWSQTDFNHDHNGYRKDHRNLYPKISSISLYRYPFSLYSISCTSCTFSILPLKYLPQLLLKLNEICGRSSVLDFQSLWFCVEKKKSSTIFFNNLQIAKKLNL